MNLKYSVREIVESAMLVALAIVLDLDGLKIRTGVNGGSISFTMIPLIILAIRIGPLKGFLGIGVVYGLITCLKDGWGIEYYPFDYLLGYGSLAIIGFFRKTILDKNKPWKGIVFLVLGVILGVSFRFVFACVDGVILAELDWVGSMAYNALYIPLSGVVSLAAMLLLYKPLQLINDKFSKKSVA